MTRLVRRLAAVLDITDTAGAARLGVGFLAFEGLVVALTGWWLHGRDGAAGVPLTVGSALLASAAVASLLPWHRWPRRAVVVVPLVATGLLAGLALGAPGAASPYVGLLALWVFYAGLAAPSGTSLVLVLPAVSAYLLLLGAHDGRHLLRSVLAGGTWVLLAEAMAARAAFASGRTAALVQQAETDPLTGVRNRRGLDAALGGVVSGDVVAVIDLDHFKQVNDRHGHAHGDAVLVAFARTLSDVVRTSDVVARLGGEEFVLVLRCGTAAAAALVLDRLRESWRGAHPEVTWSAGVAVQSAGDDPGETLRRADRALYAAKASGRDRVVPAAASGGADGPSLPAQRAAGSSREVCATTTTS